MYSTFLVLYNKYYIICVQYYTFSFSSTGVEFDIELPILVGGEGRLLVRVDSEDGWLSVD